MLTKTTKTAAYLVNRDVSYAPCPSTRIGIKGMGREGGRTYAAVAANSSALLAFVIIPTLSAKIAVHPAIIPSFASGAVTK